MVANLPETRQRHLVRSRVQPEGEDVLMRLSEVWCALSATKSAK